ncbi:MAG: phosphoribosyl-ATP diphosphatase [Rickettsiales bacterium]|nr:phosphoribosyl-ATP diphosphatase [Rickettsiales bacterium]
MIEELKEIIKERRRTMPTNSYVAKLFKKGKVKIANKLGEEAVETISAFLSEGKDEILEESADLIFHLMILLEFNELSIEDVLGILEKRIKDD